jgi:N-acetyl-gamma-glutamyl-phosphate reductase
MFKVGIVGARGYVGRELVELVGKNGAMELVLSSSARDGLAVEEVADRRLDAYALALPNGAAPAYAAAIARARPDSVIVDLSADHRFDDGWTYGQPERLRDRIRAARRIANPGCYATAMQLAIAPLLPLVDGPVTVFGVSGYSGAGTTPSPKNDPEVLKDNLIPYSLVEHIHEREVARQLGCRLFFSPHVASFFRGLSVTVSVALRATATRTALDALYQEAYGREPLVELTSDPPLPRDNAGKHHVAIGGVSVSSDGRHAVVVATIDNLLGGAATQALRNMNLALGLPELAGIVTGDLPVTTPPRELDAATR